jgi:hypothetical protein
MGFGVPSADRDEAASAAHVSAARVSVLALLVARCDGARYDSDMCRASLGLSAGLSVLACTFLGPLPTRSAFADIYMREGDNGVLHFTNMPRGRGWKRVYRTGPGKASAIRGSCANCDLVPPRDHSPDRATRFDALIRGASTLYQIPESLIRAVIQVESDYDPHVVSRAGARGLMQLMPAAQRDMGVLDVWDPRQNILGGTRLLRVLANRFAGDLVLTIAAYHAGAGAVDRYRGIPPYETTQTYIRMVLERYYRLRAAEARLAATP